MRIMLLFLACLSLLFVSCEDEDQQEDLVVQGKSPIYSTESMNISILESQPYQDLGKIVYRDSFLYINEVAKGIHVVDNRNPASPEKVKFYSIPGNTDFTLKENFIYANHIFDLVAIDVSEDDLEVTYREEGFYSEDEVVDFLHPGEDYNGFFECVDLTQGVVIGWKDSLLTNPKCRR